MSPTAPAVPETVGHRIAVLPLANISSDPKDEYFADGLTEELISTLSRIAALRVIARTSAMRYKGVAKPISEIGRELGVRTVVEGSVRKAGDRIRVTVQLIDAPSEEQLWSQVYDRDLADVFAMQRDVAQRIARSLKVRIAAREKAQIGRAATGVGDAYALYLQGRYQWNQRTESSLRSSIELFGRALEKDSRFAVAQSGLADAYAALGLLELAAPTDAFPKARQAAERALDLDDSLAEAHASLGLIRFQYDRDWDGAERELRRAIELNPNYPLAHQFFADYLKAMGRFDEALEEMRRALELDPLSLPINTGLGHVLYLSRRNDEAIDQYRKALALDPKFVLAHLWFGRPFLQAGRYEEAISEVRQAVELSGGSTISLAVLAHSYASAGQKAEAEAILATLLRRGETGYLPSYWIALIYAGLGEDERAFNWLDKACEERSSWLAWVNVEPRFDRLKAHPRFSSLLRRMRLGDGERTPPGTGVPESELLDFLRTVPELRLARYRVVGEYARFDEAARHLLKDLRQRIVARFSSSSGGLENFLLWSPPGGGKTFFVHEVARELFKRSGFEELNLAKMDERGFRDGLEAISASAEPTLCLVDEVDSQPDRTWPYESLLPHLEPAGRMSVGRVFVLAGSSGSSLEEMTRGMRSRPKGADLLSRIPRANGFSIPAMTPQDRILVAVSNLRQAAATLRRNVAEVERMALLYVALSPDLSSARQLREFTARAVERVPAGDERVRYDHLFVPGDPANKEFWARHRERAQGLVGSFVSVVE